MSVTLLYLLSPDDPGVFQLCPERLLCPFSLLALNGCNKPQAHLTHCFPTVVQSLRTHGLDLRQPCTLESFLPRLRGSSSLFALNLVAAAGADPLAQVLLKQRARSSDAELHLPLPGGGRDPGTSAENQEMDARQSHSQHVQQSPRVQQTQQQQHAQQAQQQQQSEHVLLIGPEGDWTLDELELLVQTGAVPVGLGRLRLRTETAAISLLAAVSNFG